MEYEKSVAGTMYVVAPTASGVPGVLSSWIATRRPLDAYGVVELAKMISLIW
jgi:hypothetical protein